MNDKDLIKSLGGPSKVARLLGFTAQRVSNWQRRGIPPEQKLDRPDLFLPAFSIKKPKRKNSSE